MRDATRVKQTVSAIINGVEPYPQFDELKRLVKQLKRVQSSASPASSDLARATFRQLVSLARRQGQDAPADKGEHDTSGPWKALVEMTCMGTLSPVVALGQAVTAPGQGALPAGCSPIVELARALAWPLVAGAIVLFLREPLRAFVAALGTRVTKLSIFKVELELVPAATAADGPLLDDLRTATTSATIGDSSRAMLEQVQSQTPADFTEINLGTGKEWLSSRLYIAVVMLERMRQIEVIVFVERTPTSNRHIVAVVPVRELRWALARRYPWLDAAFLRTYIAQFPTPPLPLPGPVPQLPKSAGWLPDPKTLSMTSPIVVSNSGAVNPSTARILAASFIDSLQEQIDPSVAAAAALPPPGSPTGTGGQSAAVPSSSSDKKTWTDLSTTTRERATWVTRELLEELVSPEAFALWTDIARDAPRAQRTRAVLRRGAPFVALVNKDGGFMRLVNRRALLEEVAGSLGEEPERTS
jgi:hypothetical protein